LTIRQKLYLGFGSLMFLISLFAGGVLTILTVINDNVEEIGGPLYMKVKHAYQMEIELSAIINNLDRMLLVESKEPLYSAVTQAQEQLAAASSSLSARITTNRGRELHSEIELLYGEFTNTTANYIELIRNNELDAARVFFLTEVEGERQELVRALSTLVQYQEALMEQQVADNAFYQQYSLLATAIALTLLVMILAVTAYGVTRSTMRNINYITKVLQDAESTSLEALPRMKVLTMDELSPVIAAYNRMAEGFEAQVKKEIEYSQALEEQNWIKTNVAFMTEAVQEARDLQSFGELLLNHVVPASGASVGALFYASEVMHQERYECIAGYAHNAATSPQVSFGIGEGLVGQCAASGEIIETAAPAGYIRVVSGVGEGDANYLLLVPIHYEKKVIAVLEIASFTPFTRLQRAFVEAVTATAIGLRLRDLSNQIRIQGLLQESQQYVEELQTQSEELQQQQEELRSLNEKLAEQYRDAERRNIELEQIRLELEANALELEANSRFKSEFLANISHELRTPLNSLLILAQVLGDNPEGNLTEKQREYAMTILHSGNELLALINDVLDLSKIEAGQMNIEQDMCKPSEIAEDLAKQFRTMALQKGLSYEAWIEEDLRDTLFVTDRYRLVQILKNLLSNAIKFTDQGGVSIHMYCDAKAEKISFQVRDTGVGIPADKQALVFEAFRQADGRTNRKYGGTGLGLSISRELTSMLGGEIELESEEGRGSVFTVTIPAVRLDQDALREAAAASEAAEHMLAEAEADHAEFVHAGHQQGPILLVDDDIRNVYALSAALLDRGYDVIYAANGSEAIDKLKNHPEVGLVLMDMMMPEMDGYEAIRAIRQSPQFAVLPIIAVTAKAMKQDRELCLEAGANDYLSKPVKLDKLLSLLHVWLHDKDRPQGDDLRHRYESPFAAAEGVGVILRKPGAGRDFGSGKQGSDSPSDGSGGA